jgi:hypothetical protein
MVWTLNSYSCVVEFYVVSTVQVLLECLLNDSLILKVYSVKYYHINTSTFSTAVTLHTYPPMKMEQTQCSEMLAFKLQTPANHPEETLRVINNNTSAIPNTDTTYIWQLVHTTHSLIMTTTYTVTDTIYFHISEKYTQSCHNRRYMVTDTVLSLPFFKLILYLVNTSTCNTL